MHRETLDIMVYFFPICMYNINNIIHSSNSSVTSFRYLDPIPVCVNMWKGASHTYLHQAILEHQQGVGELNSDAVCLETALAS